MLPSGFDVMVSDIRRVANEQRAALNAWQPNRPKVADLNLYAIAEPSSRQIRQEDLRELAIVLDGDNRRLWKGARGGDREATCSRSGVYDARKINSRSAR